MQPQSDDDVRSVVEALQQRLDPLLDVRWNPTAVKVRAGSFDVFGAPSRLPEYDGRWQVIRHQTANMNDREFAVILTVTAPDVSGKYPIMRDDGPYAPIGEWLVSYLALWDRANTAFMHAMDSLWEDHARAESWMRDDEQAGNHEALEKIYREFGSAYWMGGGQGRTANAPWLGDSAVRDQRRAQSRIIAAP